MPKARQPDDLVVFNYAQSKKKLPPATEIDTLIPPEIMAELTKDDAAPYFSVEAIQFPAIGNGIRYGSKGTYKKEFFNSFIEKTKEKAIPGSKFGHQWTDRPSNDFYMVGGKIVENSGSPDSGIAYFKMYIPPKGFTTENYGFIRDARAHMVKYSLVARPEYTIKSGQDGTDEYVFSGSNGGERNDAVEEGAMDQIVNSQGNELDFDAAKALIEEGHFDRDTKIDGGVIQNGMVYRSALRVMLSRANETERPALAELMSMIDKTKNGGKPVEKEEAITLLSNLISNGKEKAADIAKAVGFDAVIRNATDEANAATIKVLNDKLGDKPLEALDAMIAENKANAVAVVENAIATLTPKTVKNVKDEDVPNDAFTYAFSKAQGKKGTELTTAVENLKTDSIMLALVRNLADGNSSVHQVHPDNRKSGQVENGDNGTPTTRIKE